MNFESESTGRLFSCSLPFSPLLNQTLKASEKGREKQKKKKEPRFGPENLDTELSRPKKSSATKTVMLLGSSSLSTAYLRNTCDARSEACVRRRAKANRKGKGKNEVDQRWSDGFAHASSTTHPVRTKTLYCSMWVQRPVPFRWIGSRSSYSSDGYARKCTGTLKYRTKYSVVVALYSSEQALHLQVLNTMNRVGPGAHDLLHQCTCSGSARTVAHCWIRPESPGAEPTRVHLKYLEIMFTPLLAVAFDWI